MTIVMYGIPNCNTVKKAREWLESNQLDYVFHDYKKQGVPEGNLQAWVDAFGWERVLNRAGMTWRKLNDAAKEAVTSNEKAMALMVEKPSIIKRPIVEVDGHMLLGFKETEYQQQFNQAA